LKHQCHESPKLTFLQLFDEKGCNTGIARGVIRGESLRYEME